MGEELCHQSHAAETTPESGEATTRLQISEKGAESCGKPAVSSRIASQIVNCLPLKSGIDAARLGFRNARTLGVPFSFDVDAIVNFRCPCPALVAQRHEMAFDVNHL